MVSLLRKVIGDSNERELKRLQPLVARINALESDFAALSETELRALGDRFRARLRDGASEEELLPEVFAAVREAAKRHLGQRHYDVQLLGGMVLHQGKIAEMKTGEGKTLVATLAATLNALRGMGVHLVTVNDYLARRDTRWMGPIYDALGLTVACIEQNGVTFRYAPGAEGPDPHWTHLEPTSRAEAYQADITYGTNNEFGFDYLRDNMATDLAFCAQRPLSYAIVDEVDNILIDEARTPLIISGPAEEARGLYILADQIVRRLRPEEHFNVDEKQRTVTLTEAGLAEVERRRGQQLTQLTRQQDQRLSEMDRRRLGRQLGQKIEVANLYDSSHYLFTRYVEAALRAHVLYQRDREYVVKDREVIIVDEFTGRLMVGRRYSEGLHQAIEAKEGVPIQRESVTYATITLQNYFRLYEKLAGMTGTAHTEAEEFYKIYKLDVLVIPTHMPMIRVNHPDLVYKNEEAKLQAITREILQLYARRQPVLVGTTSIEKSEQLAERLGFSKLQALARITLLKEALTRPQGNGKDPQEPWRRALSRPLASLTPGDFNEIAQHLKVDANPLAPQNLQRLAALWGLADPERLAQALRESIPHQVLNARYHEREASIVAQAGRLGAVTIATNMAGRGTDIMLGGNPDAEALDEAQRLGLDPLKSPDRFADLLAQTRRRSAEEHEQVVALGGLHILGTERHEARRIDNQLRGRAGRQGDPGSSRFYLSLEDDLMRRFGGERVKSIMEWAGLEDEVPIDLPLISKGVENAQVKVEGYNFDIRKHLVEFDDVINTQRDIIYGERRKVLGGADVQDTILEMVSEELRQLLAPHFSAERGSEKDGSPLLQALRAFLPPPSGWTGATVVHLTRQEAERQLLEHARQLYAQMEREVGEENMRRAERLLLLNIPDSLWVEHLTLLEEMRQGIGLRAYGQTDPLVAFKREAFTLFEGLRAQISRSVALSIYNRSLLQRLALQASHEEAAGLGRQSTPEQSGRRKLGKVGRNDPCPCGSGKKYKFCHGA